MPVAIAISRLGKSYTLRHDARGRYSTLRDAITGAARELARRIFSAAGRGARPDKREEFWALRDVDISIAEGDRVGIIGRNGAGKSTLLKLLSRITEPTEGTVRVRGRLASMLEVGTGFHPELTGRENIFLNGAILGMKRAEIAKKFDEIVAFADVEKFLDTPAKHYSSGMYLRLAFAVAAHLEPDILVVDEVLAVGDAQFQKKCMGKMQDVGKQGRTVLFVSHNMAAIDGLCTRAVVLDRGRIVSEGGVAEQIAKYLSSVDGRRATLQESVQVGRVRLDRLDFSPNPAESRAPVRFMLELSSPETARVDALALVLESALDTRAAVIDLRRSEPYELDPDSSTRIEGQVTELPLVEGDYEVGIYVRAGGDEAWVRDIVTLQVAPLPVGGDIIPYSPTVRGIAQMQYTFVASRARREQVS